MAFDASGFYPAFNGVHRYVSADVIADVNTSGYFNSASGQLKVNDIIFIVDTATPLCSVAVVLSNSAGVVDISDGSAVGGMGSDVD